MSRLRERLYKTYKLEELGYDFMGFEFNNKRDLSTHHIIPKFIGGETKKSNLCILNRHTSHNYIHLIQDYDYVIFLQISKHLVDQVAMGKIDMDELKRIDELLCFFEDKYKNEQARSGEPLIKPEYKVRILKP